MKTENNNEIKYWLAFAKIDSVGSLTLRQIYEKFGSFKEAWNASASDWMSFSSLRQSSITKFKEKQQTIDIDGLQGELAKKNVKYLTLLDEEYPDLLKEIYDPPFVLFIRGDLSSCILDKTLAVVGSRKCSFSAIENTKKIISHMAASDTVIVSGMAVGIDTAAHQAAIDANLKTIAVMGSGFDNIYPSSNKKLFEKIVNGNGAVISEYYPTIRPDAFRFPRRNRIISGLSKGTFVAEAGLKSGALITAKLCLEQGRELMCLPGLVSNPNTGGTHKLLKEGAGLVTEAQDIFNYLNWNNTNFRDTSENLDLTEDETQIYDILSLESLPVDKIIESSSLTIGDIMVILTSLELKGIIKQLPGENYIRV